VEVPIPLSSLAELELVFARSRRAAAARHARAVRRASFDRRALRTLVCVAVLLAVSLAGTASAALAPVTPPPVKQSPWTAARCPAAGRFLAAFRAASLDTTLPVSLLVAVAWEESRLDEDAVSPAGARGLLQLMPATARIMAVRDASPRANILAGARYLRTMLDRFGGRLDLALSAYNAGPSAVAQVGAAPTVGTLRYALNVEARWARLASCG